MLFKSLALVLLSGSGAALLLTTEAGDAAPTPPDSPAEARPTATTVPAFDERVAPGLVDWHADLDAALAAAAESGRPVLHFQLLGELDEALC